MVCKRVYPRAFRLAARNSPLFCRARSTIDR